MSIVKLDGNNFEIETMNSSKPVLVDFWANWCGPCKMLAPILEEVASEVENVKVCKLDIDEERELALKYDIMSIPTMLVFKDGKVVDTMVGLVRKDEIIKMLEKHK